MATVELTPEEKKLQDDATAKAIRELNIRDGYIEEDKDKIQGGGGTAANLGANIEAGITGIASSALDGMLPLPCSIGGLLGGLMSQIQGLIGGVMGTISNMLNTVSGFLSGIGNMIGNILAMPSKLLQGIQTAIDNLITKAKDIIIQQINCASDLISTFLNAPAALAQGVNVAVSGVWDSVISVGDKVAEIGHAAQAIGQQLLDQAFNMQDTLNKVFQGTIGSIASSFNSTLGGAISAITGLTSAPAGFIAKVGIGVVVSAVT